MNKTACDDVAVLCVSVVMVNRGSLQWYCGWWLFQRWANQPMTDRIACNYSTDVWCVLTTLKWTSNKSLHVCRGLWLHCWNIQPRELAHALCIFTSTSTHTTKRARKDIVDMYFSVDVDNLRKTRELANGISLAVQYSAEARVHNVFASSPVSRYVIYI